MSDPQPPSVPMPPTHAQTLPKKPWYRRWWSIAIIVLVALVVIAAVVGGADDDMVDPAEEAAAAPAPTLEPEPTEEPDEGPTEEPDEGPTDQPTEELIDDAEELEAEEDGTGVIEDEEGRFVYVFEEPTTWTHDAGLTITVHGVGITSRDWLVEDQPDLEFLIEDDDRVQAWLTLEVEAVNETGEVIAWYPDQGEIVVGDEQRDADLWFSGDVGHTDWQDGVRRQDQVVFSLHTDWEAVVEQGEARYLVRGPSLSDTFDPIGDNADLAVNWER